MCRDAFEAKQELLHARAEELRSAHHEKIRLEKRISVLEGEIGKLTTFLQ